MRYYAGIGSRKCPENILDTIKNLSTWLSNHDFILRSGAAIGCDTAFEIGCDIVNGKKEIYIPWKYFNNSSSDLIVRNKKAFEIAKEFHPYYDKLSDGAKKLQARNSHQILGVDLNTPVDFVVCYTKNGTEKCGTGQALRIAKKYNIPIFNFGIYKTIEEQRIAFNEFYYNIYKKNIF